jgi:hypothetical protein
MTLLNDLAGLRARTRADRQSYWLPLLLFGFLVFGAVPLDGDPDGTDLFMPLSLLGPEPGASYWLTALVVGCVATTGWYRLRAHAIGLETSTKWYVVVTAAELAVLLVGVPLAGAALGLDGPIPLGIGFALVAIGLGTLAWLERSRLCAATAALFAIAYVLEPWTGASVLLLGGLVALVVRRRVSR